MKINFNFAAIICKVYAKILFLLLPLFVAHLFSCSSEDNNTVVTEPVSVKVSFSGFDFSVVPDQNFATSRASAAEAQVTCIAFKVFDENNKEFYAERKTKGTNENFDQINCELPAGKYTFVAVAHKAKTPSNGAANIVSPDKAVINDIILYKSTYATTMSVDITRGEPKEVTMNFGKRITASFMLRITDPYPEEVDEVEIIIDPDQNVGTPNQYTFNPSTGFSFAKQSYTTNINKKNTPNNSFIDGPMISCFLTATEQVVNVKVNMKDSSGKLIRTRTFNAVTLKQNCTTKATGYFFTNSVSNGYTFDTTDDEELSYAF